MKISISGFFAPRLMRMDSGLTELSERVLFSAQMLIEQSMVCCSNLAIGLR